MKVKELIEKLKQCDGEREVYMRFALDDEDEIGYIFETAGCYEYLDDRLYIIGEDVTTSEEYASVGQFDLKELYKKAKRINDASDFVEYMCYDKAMKGCVHDLKYSDCDKLLKILNGEEYSIKELLK